MILKLFFSKEIEDVIQLLKKDLRKILSGMNKAIIIVNRESSPYVRKADSAEEIETMIDESVFHIAQAARLKSEKHTFALKKIEEKIASEFELAKWVRYYGLSSELVAEGISNNKANIKTDKKYW
jgi:regulator of extracellular matrix RemA (YlzA/DUF370 family)